MATIEISKDKRGEFRFRVKSRNGEVIATSESYRQKAKALATLKLLKAAAGGKVVDLTAAPAKPAGKASKKAGSKPSGKSAAKKPAKAKPVAKAKKPAKAAGPAKSAAKPSSAPSAKASTKAASPAPKPAKKAAAPKPAVVDEPRLFSPASPSPRLLSDAGAEDADAVEVEAPDESEDAEQVALEPLDDDVAINDDDAMD